ncbi:MAG: restriction endonuclease [Patescibacteria group bacterium]|nr:restriction endonuclease [Patescibacteria group bacterium]
MNELNPWIELSIEYANQRSYLDDLFQVYPTIPDGIREMNESHWEEIETAFQEKNNIALIKGLIKLNLFPIKDSYVAFLKKDKKAIERNPATVARISGRLYDMGIKMIRERSSEPKETNRQIGPLFKRWINKKALGVDSLKMADFLKTTENAILDASDTEMMNFAREHLNYNRNKGLDFVARFNGKYVIGEAKFLTDFGGHQNAQFDDAMKLIEDKDVKAIKIAILDGIIYVKGGNKMYKNLIGKYKNENIMSALVLREFLYQI